MASTKYDICTTASYLVGGDDVASFDEDTKESRLSAVLYSNTKDNLLQAHPWVFAVKIEELAQTTTTPASFGYQYEYQLPADFLKIIKKDNLPFDYRIVGDKLLTNSEPVHILYISRIDDEDMPPYFVRALEMSMAELFAGALAQDESLVQLYNGLKKEAVRDARRIDSQQKPPSGFDDSSFSLIASR